VLAGCACYICLNGRLLAVYLFVGLTMMMLTLASIYDVPELNIGYHFYLKSDENKPECSRLSESPVGPKYTEEGGYQGPAASEESRD